jgi:hypothetical protein
MGSGWDAARADGGLMETTLQMARRTSDQNRKFHAICQDFARSRLVWAGRVRDAHEWKVLLISGHAVATGQGAEIIAGLEGEFVNVRESSARMSKARGSSLIEYAIAHAAHLGVRLAEYEREAA